MNYSKLKNNIESLKFCLTSEEIPKEIKEKEVNRLLNKMLIDIEELEKEDKEIKQLAWELANKLS